jgi:hypothetical protein
MESQKQNSPPHSPPLSPQGASDENKRSSKTKSWGRMISIRAANAAEVAEDDCVGPLPTDCAGHMVSESSESKRTDPAVVKLSRTPSTESSAESASATSKLHNGAQNSPNPRILVRHRSSRSSSQATEQEKDAAVSMRDRVSASTSLDRH